MICSFWRGGGIGDVQIIGPEKENFLGVLDNVTIQSEFKILSFTRTKTQTIDIRVVWFGLVLFGFMAYQPL